MRGHIQPRGANTWRLFVSLGRDDSGRRHQATRTFHGTKRQAQLALADFIGEVSRGEIRAGGERTVGRLIEEWYELASPGFTPNTRKGYESKIRIHIIPALGDVPLAELDTRRLDALYVRLGRTLKPNTVLGVHRIIHRACEQGIRWEWIRRNPATFASPPGAELHEPTDLSPELVAKLIAAADQDLADLALVGAITGMRESELCGLRWTDLDRAARTLRIWRRASDYDGSVVVAAGTKNRRVRTVSLDRGTVARLRYRRWRAVARARACDVTLAADGFIFSEVPDGLVPLSPNAASTRWYRHRKRLGVDLRFHDLRHWHASVLGDSGASIARVSKRLGHSRTSTTQNIYEHVLRVDDADLAETIADRLRG